MLSQLRTIALSGALAVGGIAYAGENSSPQQSSHDATTQQSKNDQSSQSQNGQGQQAPEGYVLVSERIVYLLGNEPPR